MLVGNRSENSRVLPWIIVAVVSVLLIGALIFGVYFYKRYHALQKNPAITQQTEQDRVMEKVQKLYNTPDEEPSIVQVKDVSKVKSQAFFKEAQKDDYVLVYQKAKLAILYREKTNRIINTGPISAGDTTQQSVDDSANQNVKLTQ